ncbi:CLUMA_CG005077, isoform A [Clunio marinus]|uniref:CLUMA_CG005077, isoform A n=1 Tax=Clunio marinus TaxID=568069 RepID=A0A1J1HVL4_9DIPT|nr:CLUMA_CG005077, isoform A [Clunio marinus]
MKVLKLLVIASILTYAAARVVGPHLIDSRKLKIDPVSKQDDDEGVIVDPVITVSDIQVYGDVAPSTASSVEENSVEVSASSAEVASAESETQTPAIVNEDDANPINRYCKCTSFECDCCREFSLPLVPIRGPGCANIRYLEGDRMSIGIKFGNRVLANRVISGRKETPVCLPLPGGFTNFCGRIYGISKKNEDFKACLGLELRADDEVEAALRVSCFSFGPRGLKVMEAEPIPVAKPAESDDAGNVPNTSSNDDDDDDDEDDDSDYTGLSLLSGDILADILGEDDDASESQATPTRKNPKRKNLISDDDDDDDDNDEEKVEEEVSQEIAENELEDDAEEEVEESDDNIEENEKDNEIAEDENDTEEQELAEAVADDGEILMKKGFRILSFITYR